MRVDLRETEASAGTLGVTAVRIDPSSRSALLDEGFERLAEEARARGLELIAAVPEARSWIFRLPSS